MPQQVHQHDVLEHVGVVARMEGVAIAEHAPDHARSGDRARPAQSNDMLSFAQTKRPGSFTRVVGAS